MPWWDGEADEIYWLEVTNRWDFGDDLKAPQQQSNGREYWGHRFIKDVQPGDVVFHYHTPSEAILASSRAVGDYWAEDIDWPPSSLAGKPQVPGAFLRPGWRRNLEQTSYLVDPIGRAELRDAQPAMEAIVEAIAGRRRGAVYFPLELSTKRPPRAMEVYISKLPSAVVELFSDLGRAATESRHAEQLVAGASEIVTKPYRWLDENVEFAEREPFAVDPSAVDRANSAHRRVQNLLATWLQERGVEPRGPGGIEAQFDLMWQSGSVTYVAEVKSTTRQNEERQLRLGLGQILRYRHLCSARADDVRAVLAVEHEPADGSWIELAGSLGVDLVWPGSFDRLVLNH